MTCVHECDPIQFSDQFAGRWLKLAGTFGLKADGPMEQLNVP
jgi:hypothetical protein